MMDASALKFLTQENGIAKLIQQPAYAAEEGGEPTISQADLIADMLNFMRLDTWAIGKAAGVDLEIERMTPEAAAVQVQALIEGESTELVDAFNEVEEMREEVLAELAGEDALEEHRALKEDEAFSFQPDNDNDPAEVDEELLEKLPEGGPPVDQAEGVPPGAPEEPLEDVVPDEPEVEEDAED